jgi:hypothetical protein
VLPVPRVPDGLTISLLPQENSRTRKAPRASCRITARSNGQVEKMNRTIKDTTVKRYHHDTHVQLRVHLQLFVDAYNHARRLKTLRGLTPYEYVCHLWTKQPERFRLNPSHHIPGPYT